MSRSVQCHIPAWLSMIPGGEFALDGDIMVGRNDPCSCGSGLKYKKCCLGSSRVAAAPSRRRRRVPPHVIAQLERHRRDEQRRLETTGHVRPVVSTEFQGHRVVRLETHATTERRTIPEGSWLVRTGQPLGTLAVYLLEPESDDGLATWNFFDDRIGVGAEFPVYRVPAALEP